MKITFLKSQAQAFEFEALHWSDDREEDTNRKLQLHYYTLLSDEDKTVFGTVFKLELLHPYEYQVRTMFVSWFKAESPIPDDFINSDFAGINAPSIAYPYLRSFIGTVTLMAGYNAATLPVVNFVATRGSMQLFPEKERA